VIQKTQTLRLSLSSYAALRTVLFCKPPVAMIHLYGFRREWRRNLWEAAKTLTQMHDDPEAAILLTLDRRKVCSKSHVAALLTAVSSNSGMRRAGTLCISTVQQVHQKLCDSRCSQITIHETAVNA
jgi:hypothetical protein